MRSQIIFLDALVSHKSKVSLPDWTISDCDDNPRIHQWKWDRIVPISWASVPVLSVPSVLVPVPSCQYHQYQNKYHQYQLQYIRNKEVNMRFWHHQKVNSNVKCQMSDVKLQVLGQVGRSCEISVDLMRSQKILWDLYVDYFRLYSDCVD